LHQFRILFLLGVQPLFELIKDDEHLLANRNALTPAKCGQRLFQTKMSRQQWTAFAKAIEETSFRLLGGGFDVNRHNILGQSRQ
jgi:hypothetical protein